MDIEELRRFFDEFPKKLAQASELALTRAAEKNSDRPFNDF